MKPTKAQIAEAVAVMGALKYFPAEATVRLVVMQLLQSMCDRNDRLDWLVKTLINHVGEWPGTAQLRALYATQWHPADGDEGPHCTIAGFTPYDAERARIEVEGREYQKRLAGWKQEARMLESMGATVKGLP